MTPEEARRIDLLVAASGMTKQDYIHAKLTGEPVPTGFSPRAVKQLKDELVKIHAELRRIRKDEEINEGLQEAITTLAELLEVSGGASLTEVEAPVDALDDRVFAMSRK